MSKEYSETLGKNIRYKKEYIGAGLYRLYIKRNDIELLEQSLQRLESIDNANPSEALEKLEEIILYLNANEPTGKYCNNIENLKNKLLKAQEQEKVLEIIKEKNVDIRWLKICNSVNKYNDGLTVLNKKILKQEFDLVKRWLR